MTCKHMLPSSGVVVTTTNGGTVGCTFCERESIEDERDTANAANRALRERVAELEKLVDEAADFIADSPWRKGGKALLLRLGRDATNGGASPKTGNVKEEKTP